VSSGGKNKIDLTLLKFLRSLKRAESCSALNDPPQHKWERETKPAGILDDSQRGE
jgi:hypothetical protein